MSSRRLVLCAPCTVHWLVRPLRIGAYSLSSAVGRHQGRAHLLALGGHCGLALWRSLLVLLYLFDGLCPANQVCLSPWKVDGRDQIAKWCLFSSTDTAAPRCRDQCSLRCFIKRVRTCTATDLLNTSVGTPSDSPAQRRLEPILHYSRLMGE